MKYINPDWLKPLHARWVQWLQSLKTRWGQWIKPLQSRWERLASRDRQIAGAVAGVMAIALLYLLVWSPLQRSLARLRLDVPNEHAQLQRMREMSEQVSRMRREAPAPLVTGSLLPTVEQSATAHGLRAAFTRLDPEGSNGVRIQVDGAPFNALIGWLADAQKQYALRAEQATIEAHAVPGSVNARLILRSASP
jgi:general secretion pathway protein M